MKTMTMTDSNDAAPPAARPGRWRPWLALLLVVGLGLINLLFGLAGLGGSAAVRQAGFGVLNVAAGALLLGLGVAALTRRRRNARLAALTLFVAAGIFVLQSGAEVIDVARGGDENAQTRIAGLLLRLLVFVPLIAGGAASVRRESQEP